MKKLPPGLTLLVATSAAFSSCVALAMTTLGPTSPVGPALVLPKNVRDLGRVSTRQEWRVTFPIRNAGARRLVLNELDVGCDCSDGVQRAILVAPGETAELEVTLDTRFATGCVENIATFTTSDPAHPRFDLTVRAWVDADEQVHRAETDQAQQFSVLVHRQ